MKKLFLFTALISVGWLQGMEVPATLSAQSAQARALLWQGVMEQNDQKIRSALRHGSYGNKCSG